MVDNFYNKEQKNDYIRYILEEIIANNNYVNDEYLTLIKNNARSQFNTISEAERLFDTDIADMDYDTLMLSLKSISSNNYHTSANVMSFFKKYINWCLSNGKSRNDINFLLGIQSKDITAEYKLRNSMFKNPEDLINFYDVVSQNLNDNDPMYMSIVGGLMSYMGISRADLSDVLKTDVDLNEYTIKYHDEVLEIPVIFRKYFDKYNNISFYLARYYRHENDKKKLDYHNYYDDNNNIIDNDVRYELSYDLRENYPYFLQPMVKQKNQEPSPKKCYGSLSTHLKKMKQIYKDITDINLYTTYNDIETSGLFYKVYQKEQSGELKKSDIIEYFSQHMLKKEMVKNNSYGERPSRRFGKAQYQNNKYQSWKKIFNL